MALTDFWEVKVVQSYPLVDEVLSLYHFHAASPPESVFEMLDDLKGALVTNVRSVVSNQLKFVRMDAVNLGNVLQNGTYDLAGIAGLRTGDANPRWMAWSLKVQRGHASMRHGWKRYCGVSETDLSGGLPTSGVVTNFTGTVIPGLTGLIAGNYTWVIVKRIKYTTPGGKDAWRMPLTDGELTYYTADEVSLAGVTTQNTRKR